jgi:hypothetical protein
MLSTVFFIVMLRVVMLSVIMPSVIMLSVIMISVVMLSVVALGSGYVTVSPFHLDHVFATNSVSLWGSTPIGLAFGKAARPTWPKLGWKWLTVTNPPSQ